MVVMRLKKGYDLSGLETGDLCLGYEKIKLLFNTGPFPNGGDCLIIEADGELMTVNSNDLIHDLEAYNLST
ncbi:MAG: hypothetical protein E4H40_02880 [Candidatus Brocadiia bacterium]|nr:MAG: hypothetical protein E4H40_02880 [Candidatus Brocadiia bacterium]